MFYRLKKGLMCRALEKRNKEKPFDYSYAEGFTLDGDHIEMNASKGTIQCLR